MTQNTSFSVHVEQHGKAFGTVMHEIRSWLDSHRIQPVDFRPGEAGPGAVAFEIKFRREDEARQFEREFARSSADPSI
jgi:hypothetical protein